MRRIRIAKQMLYLVIMLVLLEGCSGKQAELTLTPQSATSHPESATSAPTQTATLLPQVDMLTPIPPKPSAGEIEIRIPFDIFATGETPATGQPDCVNVVPFTLEEDGSRTIIKGEGKIECDFVDTPQDTPITFHLTIQLEAVLDGELLPATAERPTDWLDAYLLVDGEIVQYYSSYPSEATNPCPESNPCRMPKSEVIPLPFDFKDGSTITTPWIFILHLG